MATSSDWSNKKFIPTLIEFPNGGHLPETPGAKVYDFPKDLSPNAKSVLLYTYLTTHNEGCFQRGYFTFYTKEGDTKYSMYMNFSTGLGVSMSSSNMWLPLTPERKLYVELKFEYKEEGSKKQGSIAYKDGLAKGCKFCGEWSQVFITGYNE